MPLNLSVSATMVVNSAVVKQGTVINHEELQRIHEQLIADQPEAVHVDPRSGSIAYGNLKTSAYRQDMLTGQE